jgi:hypothetical protein
MRISDLLTAVANWLESPENEAVLLAEYHDDSLEVVASALIEAAHALRKGASAVEAVEPKVESVITSESLEEMAAVAAAFDASGDELLMKQASVLDEILLTIAAPKNAVLQARLAQDKKIEDLKKVREEYTEPKKVLDEKLADQKKTIEDSDAMKTYRPLEAPLQTRYCPDHPGAQMARVAESTFQCDMDKKVYNFEAGFETLKGNKVPGTSVENQTPSTTELSNTMFDTREGRLNAR